MMRVVLLILCLLAGATQGCGESPGAAATSELDSSTDSAMGDECADGDGGAPCPSGSACVNGQCRRGVCGDGITGLGEECDDGNQLLGDGCTPSCRSMPPDCGDAVLQEGEECDDGNWYELDACSTACTQNVCGNGREDGDEECDDGNTDNDDACTNKCEENRCRNSVLEPGEECDDGNTDPDDGCTNACKIVECGNGKLDGVERGGTEECDDGNEVDSDGCANECTANVCGNKRVDPGEVCDGNTSSRICASDCKSTQGNVACDECREEHCSTYLSEDFKPLGLCLGNEDATFKAQCSALVDCAHQKGCGFSQTGLFMSCFCGTADPSACQAAGAADGPCRQEALAAGRTTDLPVLIGSISDVSLPLGVATFLLQCETEHCLTECGP